VRETRAFERALKENDVLIIILASMLGGGDNAMLREEPRDVQQVAIDGIMGKVWTANSSPTIRSQDDRSTDAQAEIINRITGRHLLYPPANAPVAKVVDLQVAIIKLITGRN
jgi:hypothetical protein